MARSRAEWDALERAGKGPECAESPCTATCRKRWFDYGFRIGYHDGANNMGSHDDAFLTEMIERDEIEN